MNKLVQTDWSSKWAEYFPKKIAIREHESGATITYDELNTLGNRLAIYLHKEHNITKGDRIAILADFCIPHVALFTAAQKTGIILVPLNYRLTPAEIKYLLDKTQPKLVIENKKYQEKLAQTDFCQERQVPAWSTEALHEFAASTQYLEESKSFSAATIYEDDPVFILFTSGTTGFPKGALYTHKMLLWNSINTAMSLIINSSSKTINCMPPFHTGGWNVLLTPFLHHGGYSCLMRKFDAGVIIDLLEKEKATLFMGVPTMLKMMAEHEKFEVADFSSLLYIIVGGESMPIPLIEKWATKGVAIRQGYGMTEVGPNLTSLHQDDAIRKKGSIGKPNFYVHTQIIDEYGEEVANNVAGELLFKGPMVTPGYWQNEEATQKAFYKGWFRTGDRVLRDEEGYLYIVDRIKNMFISGGENVYPAEVERILLTHPNISEAIVIGVPDEKWGESGKAFLVSTQPIDKDEVIVFAKKYLAKFKVPKHIQFMEQLPKNDTGKINRKALKEM
ncbi:MAG: AMP-binding protein [Bacteroidota bacterium]